MTVAQPDVKPHLIPAESDGPAPRNPISTRNYPMRRSLIMLALAAGAALTTAAQAQTGPGTIYYRYGSSTTDAYKVSGDGTNNTKLSLSSSPNVHLSTSLANHPGGRQFFGGS